MDYLKQIIFVWIPIKLNYKEQTEIEGGKHK